MELSIIIPAYNEQRCLKQSVDKVERYLQERYEAKWETETEIILVLEKSTDDTVLIGRHLGEEYPNICTLYNNETMGKGFSVRRGMLAAHGQYRVFMDADLSTPVETLDQVIRQLRSHSVVIGSRHCPGAQIVYKQPLRRRLSGLIFRFITKVLLKLPYKDTQCGFKGFRGEWTEVLFQSLSTNGFTFDVEILLRAHSYLGCSVREIPVRWSDSDHSSVSFRRDTMKILRELWYLRQSYRTQGAIRCETEFR